MQIGHLVGVLDARHRAKGRHELDGQAYVSEELFKVADRCVQILGGMGISDETPVGMIFSDMRAFRLYDGPTEVHKYAIARQVLRTEKGFPMSVLDMFRLDDKVVVVTGASSGLGVSFAEAFAEAGADVVLGARRVERLEQTAELVTKAGRRVASAQTDVVDPEQCQRLVDTAMETFGRVDILINNAGVGSAVPATRETPEQFRSIVDVNLHGSYWMAQACGRVMPPGSAIINISSILGITTAALPKRRMRRPRPGIIGLTRDLAQQWGSRKGIRVNALAPASSRPK